VEYCRLQSATLYNGLAYAETDVRRKTLAHQLEGLTTTSEVAALLLALLERQVKEGRTDADFNRRKPVRRALSQSEAAEAVEQMCQALERYEQFGI
jgi:hypothetical protein